MKNMIIAHNGSVQNIPNIPADVKAICKTIWEISQKKVLDLAADRGAYICKMGPLTSMHFYEWKKGLKTGMYYLRTRPAAQAIQFTVDQSVLKDVKKQQEQAVLPAHTAPNGRPTEGGRHPTRLSQLLLDRPPRSTKCRMSSLMT